MSLFLLFFLFNKNIIVLQVLRYIDNNKSVACTQCQSLSVAALFLFPSNQSGLGSGEHQAPGAPGVPWADHWGPGEGHQDHDGGV